MKKIFLFKAKTSATERQATSVVPLEHTRMPSHVQENQKLLDEIRQTQMELEAAYDKLSNVVEPEMIDYTIYHLNAVQKQYEYLLGQAKIYNLRAVNQL